jgi:hypothetical protein
VESAPSRLTGRTTPILRRPRRTSSRRSPRSSATLAGEIEIPAGGWEGKTLRVDFGGVAREFQLDSRGRGTRRSRRSPAPA